MEKIRLMQYSASWSQEFEQTKSMLLWATEGWISDACHIGGTAVEGSIAAPTIDVVAGITDLTGLNQAALFVEGLHYRRLPAPDWCERELVAWLHKPWDGFPTHTVLIVRHGGAVWQSCLSVACALKEDYRLCQSLENLKRDHLEAQSTSLTYAAAKNEFFQQVLNSRA